MKQLLLLAIAFLFPASLGLTQDIPRDGKSALESAIVSLGIEEPHNLDLVMHMVSEQLPLKPSFIYEPGTEKVQVPRMQVENVRFGDLMSALEGLSSVQFNIKNPSPKPGESSLLIVEMKNSGFGMADFEAGEASAPLPAPAFTSTPRARPDGASASFAPARTGEPIAPAQPAALPPPSPEPMSAPAYTTLTTDEELLAALADQGPMLTTHPDGSKQLLLTRPH